MKYVSTRGGVEPAEFCDILIEGLAADGGLYVPESIPYIDIEVLEGWRNLTYKQVALQVLSLLITDIPYNDLKNIIDKTYTLDNFESSEIVPLKKFKFGHAKEFYLLGLSEGPTLAFKDLPLQFLGNLYEYVLNKKQTYVNVLGSTSGDTGSAAEYALKGKKGVNVFMLSPHGRMSDFQKAQMYTLDDPNIHNLAVKGVFDECQDIVKAINGDLEFKRKHHIAAVNSINFARIAAQVVYYFWAWLQVSKPVESKYRDSKINDNLKHKNIATYKAEVIDVTVPTGNFGNILAALIASMMGCPLGDLIVATNENNVLEEFFKTGVYKPRIPAETIATSSPSMDISKASNFERFVYFLYDCDASKVKDLWSRLAEDGSFDLSERLSEIEGTDHFFTFKAGRSTHEDRIKTIKDFYDKTEYILDPHTADGVKVSSEFQSENKIMVVAETALSTKFAITVKESLGFEPKVPERFNEMLNKPRHEVVTENSVEEVKDYIQNHS